MEVANTSTPADSQNRHAGQHLSLGWINDLYQIGRAVAGASDREASHQAVLEHLARGFDAASGCLALTEPDGRHLRIVAGLKLPPGVINSTVDFGERILGWVAENAAPVLLNGDVSKDKRFRNLTARRQSGIPMVAMCLPLRVEGRVVGVLSLNREVGSAPFLEPDLDHATGIADLVAIVIENAALHAEQTRRIGELTQLNARLNEAQSQLLQSEKMASIGQLAAGVAHEINNPVGYVNSNIGTLQQYVNDLFRLMTVYEQAEAALPADSPIRAELGVYRQAIDINFLREDTLNLVKESQEGLTRVRKIVQDLKEFSHVDRAEWQETDLHQGLDSTLNIVNNELKYKAEVVKEYGQLPPVQCIPSQLNQVFMNLLVNAAQAIEKRGTITIRTGAEDDGVYVEISDTGKGMTPEVQKRIFEPFFTTKPVGKGTGLGLSLSYGIVQKHHGRIEVSSVPGQGTTFRIRVPQRQSAAAEPTPSLRTGT
jgi:signal transduction histidine kinase